MLRKQRTLLYPMTAGNSKGTILVTGANGGLGTAIIQNIVADPDLTYHGLYTLRDVSTATSLQLTLASTKSRPHDVIQLDLSKLSSVREAAAAINDKVSAGEIPRIRALISLTPSSISSDIVYKYLRI